MMKRLQGEINMRDNYAKCMILVVFMVLTTHCLSCTRQQNQTPVPTTKIPSQSSLTIGKQIKVAVIDTGFDFNSKWSIQPKLCATGHKDFTGTGLQDNHGHGTHIAGLIAKYAGEANYCLVIIKFFDPKEYKPDNVKHSTDAFNYAVDQEVDVINYSGGGTEYSEEEYNAVLKALNADITIVAAAGNERSDLTKTTYYPALYDSRIEVVGAIDANADRIPASNYGPQVDAYEQGKNVLSNLPNNSYGYMTGTSQATAIHTGKIVNEVYKVKKLYDKYEYKPSKTLVASLAQQLNVGIV